MATARHPYFLPQEWPRLGRLYAVVALLHALGWGLYLHFAGRYPALVGLGFVAYLFGLRHAFDADHIAAIDDTVPTIGRSSTRFEKTRRRGARDAASSGGVQLHHGCAICSIRH